MKNKKLIIALIVILAVGAVATATGLTAAYWIGAEGDSEIAPQTDTTDWNYWSKYFIYEAVVESGTTTGYRIIGFDGAVYENVIIPRKATGGRLLKDDGTYTTITDDKFVLFVGNSTFADTTDKTVPVTLTLPTTVAVEPGAFMGLVNLTTIKIVSVVGDDISGNYDTSIEIGSSAFFGCNNVTKFIAESTIQFTCDGDGVGFDALKTATGLPTSLGRSAS